MSTPLEVLKKYWNYDDFRASQAEIINTLLQQKNVFALLPTGAGKSICFQVPALLVDGVCVVISPLIALMQDQVNSLKKKGIKAAMLSATLKQSEVVELFDNLRYGGYKFLYLSPERLQSDFIQEKLKQLHVSIIAIDEAHCISEWGHDFRPSYRKVTTLTKLHPTATLIALTASATAEVVADILENLELKDIVTFKASLKRPELNYKVIKTDTIRDTLKELLSDTNSPSIVYTSSRKSARSISDYLNQNNYKSSYYHGGLSPTEKQEAYKNWLSETTPIMVATNAFGMGIDKDNITTIIHVNLPFSIENYMQESGRAGRNGSQSTAYLLYNEASVAQFNSNFEKAAVSLNFLKEVYSKLNQYYRIAIGEKPLELLQFDMAQFCTTYKFPYLKTFNAISVLVKEGVIEVSENLYRKSSLKFVTGQQQIFRYVQHYPSQDKLIKALLRTYGGLFELYTKIDEFIISRKINATKEATIKLLLQLHNDKIVVYKPVASHYSISFLVPREDTFTINRIATHVKQRQYIKQEKQEAVLAYVMNTIQCRSRLLLHYFDEDKTTDCGSCDVCLSKNAKVSRFDVNSMAVDILNLLKDKSLTSKELVKELQLDKKAVFTTLQLLLEKNKIAITSQNKFQRK